MRTTIRMDDDLIESAKAAAMGARQTLTRFIEDAVRRQLALQDKVAAASTPELPVFSGDGFLPGVDIDNNAALLDVMESRP